MLVTTLTSPIHVWNLTFNQPPEETVNQWPKQSRAGYGFTTQDKPWNSGCWTTGKLISSSEDVRRPGCLLGKRTSPASAALASTLSTRVKTKSESDRTEKKHMVFLRLSKKVLMLTRPDKWLPQQYIPAVVYHGFCLCPTLSYRHTY